MTFLEPCSVFSKVETSLFKCLEIRFLAQEHWKVFLIVIEIIIVERLCRFLCFYC